MGRGNKGSYGVRKTGFYAVNIIMCIVPAALTAAFYAIRSQYVFMDAFGKYAAQPVRAFMARICSAVHISVAETLITFVIAWTVIFLAVTIIGFFKSRVTSAAAMTAVAQRGTNALWEPPQRRIRLIRRLLFLASVALFIWCGFCWLWGTAYYETGFAAKNGFTQSGVTAEELERVTRLYLEKANELAPLVPRDEDKHFAARWEDYADTAAEVYKNLDFIGVDTELYTPKRMFYSKLMSRLNYTGFYFAFTGEANINADAPGCLIPATMTHELAHQCGYAAEEEANFLAIASCISSGDTIYEYSGYLMGLIHLMNALWRADNFAYFDISTDFCDELRRDMNDNSEYWQTQKTVESTGIEIIDNTLTAVTEAAEEAVTAFYDGYLKGYGQTLGIRSYGACVDLLVEWADN